MAKEIQLKDGSGNVYPHPYWPIGAIFISVVNENPSKYFGGTWVSFGAGRCIVGVDTSQSEFNSVQKTGGAKTVALTTAQMPSHSHSIGSGGSHDHDIYFRRMTGPTAVTSGGWYAIGSSANNNGGTGAVLSAGSHTHTMNSAGGGSAHSNLQPYITVYMWRRTA